ncbi:MAG TPA: histidine phosphatase family protein [Pyrinomonadaceae bacterium]|nr:histidine phosphatase family protein [Pyrinomonadaceae bacterium]
MKTLLLLRHAKSSWKDSSLADHERTLNGRGRRAAELVRSFLERKNLRPQLVLSSSAVRTRQTVEIIFDGAAPAPDIRYDDALYLASAGKLLELISTLEEDRDRVLLVGHNPGMEELFFRLTGLDERFPTATLANIGLNIEKWREAKTTRGRLEWLVTPKQLEVS